MADDAVAAMSNDLAPAYAKPEEGELARGVGREAVREIVGFYRSRIERFDNMAMNCADCRFLNGAYCRHWQDRVPDEFRSRGCEAWQWDGVPF